MYKTNYYKNRDFKLQTAVSSLKCPEGSFFHSFVPNLHIKSKKEFKKVEPTPDSYELHKINVLSKIPTGIPGYNIVFLFSIFSVGIIIILKKLKITRKRFFNNF